MKYEYNSHLTFEERVVDTASEIKKKYPLISIDDAIKAASLARPVEDRVSNDDKFSRMYYILFTIGRDHVEFSHVFNDMFNVYEAGLKNSSYINVMREIIDYMDGKLDSFPMIS